MQEKITPARISGTVSVPASKSHTIRALLIASLADGTSIIRKPLFSEDTSSCIRACSAFGAEIKEEHGDLIVTGNGGRMARPANVIDIGNSGTTLYLAAGAAALGTAEYRFTGDSQIQARPIDALLRALGDLGADAASVHRNGCAPVTIRGPLTGGTTSIECPTSQYLSSLLLSAPLARGDSVIDVLLLHEQPYVEMTLRWLDEQNINYKRKEFRRFEIAGGQRYRRFDRNVPADFSSATFFFCAAALTGSEITLTGLDMDDSQGDKAIIPILRRMGCRISNAEGVDSMNGITITGPSDSEGDRLTGCTVDLNPTPDVLPALAAAACFASGETCLVNVPQARLKETDRIRVMREELSKMGADIEELPDGLVIRGGKKLKGCTLDGRSDHRVVMALAIAGLGAEGETIIKTAEAVDITFPDFFPILRALAGGRNR